MIFIERNEAGEIIGVFENPQPGKDLERVERDSDEVVAFMDENS